MTTELRRLAEAATPGPWTVYMGDRVCSDDVYDIAICEDASLIDDDDELTSIQCDANAAYIAAMHPETTLALLDRLARAETLVAQCKATLEAMHPATGMPDDVARLYSAMMEALGDER